MISRYSRHDRRRRHRAGRKTVEMTLKGGKRPAVVKRKAGPKGDLKPLKVV